MPASHPAEGLLPCYGRADLFFPEQGEAHKVKAAKFLCNTKCSYRNRCLEQALEINKATKYKVLGIWGGTTEDERRALRGLTTRNS